MIAALSPASVNYEETLSTLRYAGKAQVGLQSKEKIELQVLQKRRCNASTCALETKKQMPPESVAILIF